MPMRYASLKCIGLFPLILLGCLGGFWWQALRRHCRSSKTLRTSGCRDCPCIPRLECVSMRTSDLVCCLRTSFMLCLTASMYYAV
ncbi:hypothetical protein QR685DRAFT_166942 [Neurospora intermedia]|uniref:Secreted protein n=1 Tax=Neurospora intermedia TaxID=5142 RepID=A0ABR3DKK7_NEUIN